MGRGQPKEKQTCWFSIVWDFPKADPLTHSQEPLGMCPAMAWDFAAQKEHSNPFFSFFFIGPTVLYGSSLVSSSSHNL